MLVTFMLLTVSPGKNTWFKTVGVGVFVVTRIISEIADMIDDCTDRRV